MNNVFASVPYGLRIAVGAVLLFSLSCSPDPKTDGEMHWQVPQSLQRCDTNAECGDTLSCFCGVCSVSCTNDLTQCDGAPNAAVGCQSTDDISACGSVGDICLVNCQSNSDCAVGFECVENACVVPTFDPMCADDTDDDGLVDCDETYYGLDPTKPSTFDDGVNDAERWFVDLCPPPRIAGCATCDFFEPQTDLGHIDLFFVLDASGSMTDDYARLTTEFSDFIAALESRRVDTRFAMASMSESADGRPVNGWLTGATNFDVELTTFLANDPQDAIERGFDNAKAGLQYLASAGVSDTDRPRDTAEIVTLFVSDEDDTTSVDAGTCSASACPAIIETDFIDFFSSATTAVSIVAEDQSCGSEGFAYLRAASASGGQSYNLCDTFVLDPTPLAAMVSPFAASRDASSADVFVDGTQSTTFSLVGERVVFESDIPADDATVVIRYPSCD